jgi:hypothetical protein
VTNETITRIESEFDMLEAKALANAVDWQSRAIATGTRDESQDLYLDTHMICSGSALIERYPASDKSSGFGGVDVSHYVPASELEVMQARAIAAEARVKELSRLWSCALRQVRDSIPASDLAQKIGEAWEHRSNSVSATRVNLQRGSVLWVLLDRAAALVGKADG